MSEECTPKSCNCWICKRMKASKSGKLKIKMAEHALRRKNKMALQKSDVEALEQAPHSHWVG